jgi:hypothetical protein
LLALLATGATSWVPRRSVARYPDIMGCEQGCAVAAGGWPFAFILDYPGISPVGSVSLVNAVIGIDQFAWGPLLADLLFWTLVAGAALLTWRRGMRR